MPLEVAVPTFLPDTVDDYRDLSRDLHELFSHDRVSWNHRMRMLGRWDLYFLMREILTTREWPHPEDEKRKLFDCEWYLWLCRVAQFAPNDTLNIISRNHGKSTVGTFGDPIHQMIVSPNLSGGLFSVTKDISLPFVELVKTELEVNDFLQMLYPDVFYREPATESPRWTGDKGFFIRRQGKIHYKDSTLAPYALASKKESTSKRMSHMWLDDVITQETVDNPDVVRKVNKRHDQMINLGMPGTRRRAWGTFQSGEDSYHHMIGRGWKLNHMACYEMNYEKSRFREESGIPVKIVVKRDRPMMFSCAFLREQEERMGQTTFAIQMLGAPASYEVSEFKDDWLRYYDASPFDVAKGANRVIIGDPASRKGSNKHSRTAIAVLAKRGDQNYYVLDMVLDRLNLAQRADALFELHRRWNPQHVYWEELGHSSDIEHFQYVMSKGNYHFTILPTKGNVPKDKRIERLVPVFRDKRWLWPERGVPYRMIETGQDVDLVEWVIERELLPFPNVEHLDWLDAAARIVDPAVVIPWPNPEPESVTDAFRRAFYEPKNRTPKRSWMSQ